MSTPPELEGYDASANVVMLPPNRAKHANRVPLFHGTNVAMKPGEIIAPGGPYSSKHAWATEGFDLASGYSADHEMMEVENAEDMEKPYALPMFLPVHEVEAVDRSENFVQARDFTALSIGSKKGWKVKKTHWVPSEFTDDPNAVQSAL